MKTLIVYYSRTGLTKKIAENMKNKILESEIEEVESVKNRSGILGYLLSGKEAVKGTLADIKETKFDLNNYDLTILGTPVWGGNISSPIRAYIEKNKDELKNIAIFFTQGSSGAERAKQKLEKFLNKNIENYVIFTSKEIVQNKFDEKLNIFVNNLIK